MFFCSSGKLFFPRQAGKSKYSNPCDVEKRRRTVKTIWPPCTHTCWLKRTCRKQHQWKPEVGTNTFGHRYLGTLDFQQFKTKAKKIKPLYFEAVFRSLFRFLQDKLTLYLYFISQKCGFTFTTEVTNSQSAA